MNNLVYVCEGGDGERDIGRERGSRERGRGRKGERR